MALDFQYDELMLENSELRNMSVDGAVYGFAFELAYPSYRGTFLSCIEQLKLWLDGQAVPEEDMRFTLGGKQFLVSELPELSHEYWFVLERATVTVLRDGGLSDRPHSLKLLLRHRVPYTGYFGQYLTLESTGEICQTPARGEERA